MKGDKLFLAAETGNNDEIISSIEQGSSINITNEYGWTALHISIVNNNNKTSRLLMELGADVNAQDNLGRTPLHFATIYDHTYEISPLLISKGANPNIPDINGQTPNDWLTKTVKKLEEKISSSTPNIEEKTPPKEDIMSIPKESITPPKKPSYLEAILISKNPDKPETAEEKNTFKRNRRRKNKKSKSDETKNTIEPSSPPPEQKYSYRNALLQNKSTEPSRNI